MTHRAPSRLRRPAGSGFTLIELLVVISVIIILASLAMPTITGSLKSAVDTNCVSNLKQISTAFVTYISHYQGWMPATGAPNQGYPRWQHNLEPLIRVEKDTKNIFACPAKEVANYGYGLNHMWSGPDHIFNRVYGGQYAMNNRHKEVGQLHNWAGTIAIVDCGYLANNTDGGGDNYTDTSIPVSEWRETNDDNINGCTRYPYDNWPGHEGNFIWWHKDPRRPFPRHGTDSSKTSTMFFDGHVEVIETEDIVDDMWDEPKCLYDNDGHPSHPEDYWGPIEHDPVE